MRIRRWVPAVLAVALAALGAVTPATGASVPGEAAATKDRVVTLITGDKVVLQGGDEKRLMVQRGPGRDAITFESRRTRKEWSLVPSDVRAAVRSGRLDRRLFDLDLLLRDGYDDASRGDIPVLVTGARVTPRSASVVRTLRSGTAVRVAKNATTGFLDR